MNPAASDTDARVRATESQPAVSIDEIVNLCTRDMSDPRDRPSQERLGPRRSTLPSLK